MKGFDKRSPGLCLTSSDMLIEFTGSFLICASSFFECSIILCASKCVMFIKTIKWMTSLYANWYTLDDFKSSHF